MQLYQLTYFVTVMDFESFTAASKHLHISQPSLSASIKNLESGLGYTLIDRRNRKVTLTREGEFLYHEAKKLILHFENVKNESEKLNEIGPMELSLGIIESSKFWSTEILKEFTKKYPDIYIELKDILGAEEVLDAFNNFEIHACITNQYVNDPDIRSIPLYEEEMVALIPDDHHLTDKSNIKINDLADEKLIIAKKGYQTREDIMSAFNKAGIIPNLKFDIERLETACDLVDKGLGISLIPENYLKADASKSYHMKKIKHPNLSRMVYLSYDQERYLPPLVEDFIDITLEYFDKPPEDYKKL